MGQEETSSGVPDRNLFTHLHPSPTTTTAAAAATTTTTAAATTTTISAGFHPVPFHNKTSRNEFKLNYTERKKKRKWRNGGRGRRKRRGTKEGWGVGGGWGGIGCDLNWTMKVEMKCRREKWWKPSRNRKDKISFESVPKCGGRDSNNRLDFSFLSFLPSFFLSFYLRPFIKRRISGRNVSHENRCKNVAAFRGGRGGDWILFEFCLNFCLNFNCFYL